MYGQCMKEKIPSGKYKIVYNDLNLDNPGFYYIICEQEMNIPVLPIKKDGKLMFVNGIIEGLYWYEEIKLFIKYGGKIIKIKYCILSQLYIKSLKSFIEENEGLRSEGGILKQIGKNNNTFYGRLGMSNDLEIEEIYNKNKYFKVKDYGFVKTGFLKKSGSIISNIIVAASITSKARIKLYEGFMDVERKGGRILYCDTDSIIASFKKNNNIENKILGEVYFDTSLNDTCISDCVFCLPKTYSVVYKNGDEVVKIKGLKSDSVSFNDVKNSFYNNSNTFIFIYFLLKLSV